MMLFVPTAYMPVKAVLLFLILGIVAVGALFRGRLALHPVVQLWTLFMVVVGLSFMLIGLFAGNPGALRVGTVYALWPLVYTMLIAGAADEKVLVGLLRTLIVATVAIGLYGLSYILNAAGWLPDVFFKHLDLEFLKALIECIGGIPWGNFETPLVDNIPCINAFVHEMQRGAYWRLL